MKYVGLSVRLQGQPKEFCYILAYGEKLFALYYNDILILLKFERITEMHYKTLIIENIMHIIHHLFIGAN